MGFLLFLLRIVFICFGFLGIYLGWSWFTTKDYKTYEVIKLKDGYYVQNSDGKYLTNYGGEYWWSSSCKEQYCKFTTPELASEQLRRHGHVSDNTVYVRTLPSPACKLKQQFYNWLKEDC